MDGKYALGQDELKDKGSSNTIQGVVDPQSLLTWAIANSDPDVLSAQAHAEKKLQPIDKKWIDAILGESETDQMKKLIQTISDRSKIQEERLGAYVLLAEFVDTLSNANDLHKMGGLTLIIEDLKTDTDIEIKIAAANVIAICVPNNPSFQALFIEFHGFDVLFDSMQQHDPRELQGKALLAMSGLLRNNEKGILLFIQANGIMLLKRILDLCSQDNDARILRRSSSLLAWLLEWEFDRRGQEEEEEENKIDIASSVIADNGMDLFIRLLNHSYQEKDFELLDNLLEVITFLVSTLVIHTRCQVEETLVQIVQKLKSEHDTGICGETEGEDCYMNSIRKAEHLVGALIHENKSK